MINMKKKKIIVVTLVVLAFFVIIFGLIKLISNRNSASNSIDLQAPPLAVNKSVTFNENGYYTYFIEGVISNVQSTDPLILDVLIRTDKIIPEYTEPLIKTIVLENEAEVIMRNLITNEESTISAFTSLKKDDDIVAWLVEPNTKLLELDKFAATKIIINR